MGDGGSGHVMAWLPVAGACIGASARLLRARMCTILSTLACAPHQWIGYLLVLLDGRPLPCTGPSLVVPTRAAGGLSKIRCWAAVLPFDVLSFAFGLLCPIFLVVPDVIASTSTCHAGSKTAQRASLAVAAFWPAGIQGLATAAFAALAGCLSLWLDYAVSRFTGATAYSGCSITQIE